LGYGGAVLMGLLVWSLAAGGKKKDEKKEKGKR
jgi:hypothetical protein